MDSVPNNNNKREADSDTMFTKKICRDTCHEKQPQIAAPGTTKNIKHQPFYLNKKDKLICFEETEHVYYLDPTVSNPEDYFKQSKDAFMHTAFESVTTFTSKALFDPFEPYYSDELTLVMNGLNWRCRAAIGTVCHALVENLYKERQRVCPDEELTLYIKDRNFVDEYFKKIETMNHDYWLVIFGEDYYFKFAEHVLQEVKNVFGEERAALFNIDEVANLARKAFLASFMNNKIKAIIEKFKEWYVQPEKWQVLKPDWIVVVPEFICYSSKLGLAGSIDMMVYTDKTKTSICLIDWKTNKAQLNNKKYRVKNVDSPFSKDSLSTLGKYHCQLHTYANILENFYQDDLKVTNLVICHFNDLDGVTEYVIPSQHECKCRETLLNREKK